MANCVNQIFSVNKKKNGLINFSCCCKQTNKPENRMFKNWKKSFIFIGLEIYLILVNFLKVRSFIDIFILLICKLDRNKGPISHQAVTRANGQSTL